VGYDLYAGDNFKVPANNGDTAQQIVNVYFAAGQGNAATYFQGHLYLKSFSGTTPVEFAGAVSWLQGTSIVSFSGYTLLQVPPETELCGGDFRNQDVRDIHDGLDIVIKQLRESPHTGPNAFTYRQGKVYFKNFLNTKGKPSGACTSWVWVKNS